VPADKIILSGKDQHHECLEEASWLFDYNENLY
ncbi:dTDP-4-dehydrorhamnose 3,5-epimerase, partial [Bacteroides xylanisolvens]